MHIPSDISREPSQRMNDEGNSNICMMDHIAYMMKFYPSPKFLQMTFEDDTSASSNHSENSQESIPDVSSSSDQQFTDKKPSPKNNSTIGGYGLSEIKAKNFGLEFNGKKLKQTEKKSAFQTQFDYEQLIGQLSFNDHIQEKVHFSAQKPSHKMDQFDLEEKDKSFTSEKKEKKDDPGFDDKSQKLKLHQTEKKSTKKAKKSKLNQFKWDPLSEIIFRRENKLKTMITVLSILNDKNLQSSFNKIWLQAKRKPCKKCKQRMRNNEVLSVCSNCQSKESSMIEKDSIKERSISKAFGNDLSSSQIDI